MEIFDHVELVQGQDLGIVSFSAKSKSLVVGKGLLVQMLNIEISQLTKCFYFFTGAGLCPFLDPIHGDGHLGHPGQGWGSEGARSCSGKSPMRIEKLLIY